MFKKYRYRRWAYNVSIYCFILFVAANGWINIFDKNQGANQGTNQVQNITLGFGDFVFLGLWEHKEYSFFGLSIL